MKTMNSSYFRFPSAQDLEWFEMSLEKAVRHECCEESTMYIRPPRRGGEKITSAAGSKITYHPIRTWVFDIGDGGVTPDIKYCPFCGLELVELMK